MCAHECCALADMAPPMRSCPLVSARSMRPGLRRSSVHTFARSTIRLSRRAQSAQARGRPKRLTRRGLWPLCGGLAFHIGQALAKFGPNSHNIWQMLVDFDQI